MPEFKVNWVDYWALIMAVTAVLFATVVLKLPVLVVLIFVLSGLIVEQLIKLVVVSLLYKYGVYKVPVHPDDVKENS